MYSNIADSEFSKDMEFHVCKDMNTPLNKQFNELRRIPSVWKYTGRGISGTVNKPKPEEIKRYFLLLGA